MKKIWICCLLLCGCSRNTVASESSEMSIEESQSESLMEEVTELEVSEIEEVSETEANEIERMDNIPPVISGAEKDFEVMENESYSLEEVIVAYDETDGQVKVEFVGDWNSHRAGIYPVTAVAKDSSGNITEVKFNFVTIQKEVIASNVEEHNYVESSEVKTEGNHTQESQPGSSQQESSEPAGCSFKMWDENQDCNYVNYDAYRADEYFENDTDRVACNLKGSQLLEEGKANNYMCEDVLANDGHYWGSALHINW